MIDSFFSNNHTDFKYPEIGICVGVLDDTIKLSLPIATPTLPMTTPYDYSDGDVKTNNIVSSKSRLNIHSCNTSNYIVVKKPSCIDNIHDGDKVVVVFIGGDVNNPVIIGRYDE